MEKLGRDEHAIWLIINGTITEDYLNTQSGKSALDLIHQSLDSDIAIPYDQIARYVYFQNLTDSDEENEFLNKTVKLVQEKYSGDNYQALKSNLDKIKSNYKLSIEQKKYFDLITNNVTEKADHLVEITEELEKTIDKLQKTSEELEEDYKEMSDTKSSIYTDFIAILGVFSAFVFLMFGGVDVLKSVFDVVDNLETVSLKRLIIIGSMMIITLLTLMYSLLLLVSRITNKDFGQKCFHQDCQESCQHKIKHAFYRHSFFFGLLFLFVIIIRIAQLYM